MEQTERDRFKQLHARIREAMTAARVKGSGDHRYTLLAWAYVRGFGFRRIEATHHMQKLSNGSIFEHNMPSVFLLTKTLATLLERDEASLKVEIKEWLAEPPRDPVIRQALRDRKDDPKTAIFYPAVRVKPDAQELVECVSKMAKIQSKRRAIIYVVLDGVVHRVKVERLFRAMLRNEETPIVTRSMPGEPAVMDGAE